MHCKDVVRKADGTFEWAAMGRGIIDYVGQFRALVQAGYSGTMSLETHWKGAGSAEESSRQSMAGMKGQLSKASALLLRLAGGGQHDDGKKFAGYGSESTGGKTCG